MKTVTATKANITIRSPPKAEEMTVAVIGTLLCRADVDGETNTWEEEGLMLEFAADITRHEDAHIVLEVDMRLSISVPYRNIIHKSTCSINQML